MPYLRCEKCGAKFTGWAEGRTCGKCGGKLIEVSQSEFDEKKKKEEKGE